MADIPCFPTVPGQWPADLEYEDDNLLYGSPYSPPNRLPPPYTSRPANTQRTRLEQTLVEYLFGSPQPSTTTENPSQDDPLSQMFAQMSLNAQQQPATNTEFNTGPSSLLHEEPRPRRTFRFHLRFPFRRRRLGPEASRLMRRSRADVELASRIQVHVDAAPWRNRKIRQHGFGLREMGEDSNELLVYVIPGQRNQRLPGWMPTDGLWFEGHPMIFLQRVDSGLVEMNESTGLSRILAPTAQGDCGLMNYSTVGG